MIGQASVRRPAPLWPGVVVVALVGPTYWRHLLRLCADLHYNDFGKFYYGIIAWQAGHSLYSLSPASYNPALPAPLTNLNPPHGMLFVWPFAVLPIEWAFAAWMLVNGAALVWAVTLVMSETRWRPTWWQLIVLVLGAPTTTWLVTGQLSGVLIVPLTLAWRAWRHDRWWVGGIWFGLALAIKPFLGLFAVWLALRRRWLGLAGVTVSAIVLVCLGLAVYGWSAFRDWLAATSQVSWVWGAMNASLLGILTRTLTTTPYHVPLFIIPWIVFPLWFITALGVMARLWRCLRTATVDEAWTRLAMASLLLSPLGWSYYLWWLLPGLPRLLSLSSSILLLMPLVVVGLLVFPSPTGLVSLVFGSAYGWALLHSFVSQTRRGSDSPTPLANILARGSSRIW